MTLEEGKRKVVLLLEGYAGEGEIEVDADIALKMNDFFDIAQKDVALWQHLPTPATITADTDGAYEFEVSEEAANCLPFFVAAQHLLSEPEIDYGAFYNLYLQMRALLPRDGGDVKRGYVRQALFRRG